MTKKRAKFINDIEKRARKAFDTYERTVRPHYHELVETLEPQADRLKVGVRGLIEVLGLFQEISQLQDALAARAREGKELEGGFWNDLAQETTLAVNIREIIMIPDVLAEVIADAPPETIEYAISQQDARQKKLIRKALE